MLLQKPYLQTKMWSQWVSGVQYEIDYWKNYVSTGGGVYKEDFEKRCLLDIDFDDMISPIISRLPKTNIRILDVGSGPLTCLGSKISGYEVEVIPTDPLAFQYNRILEMHQIVPRVSTTFALGEELEIYFPRDSFEIVHCQNALDHSLDPTRALIQMFVVCKVGGYVMLRHAHNEAERENYAGFHQWNLTLKDGHFIIWNKDEEINFSDEVAGFASHEILMQDGYLINVFRKRADVPLGLCESASARMSNFQAAVVASLGHI